MEGVTRGPYLSGFTFYDETTRVSAPHGWLLARLFTSGARF